MSARSSQKPWPMKWIALAIIIFIALYTFLTLHFRKPGRAYRPYQDTKDRIVAERLKSAGYRKVDALCDRPADPSLTRSALGNNLSSASAALGGVPTELAKLLGDPPLLPQSVANVVAPREANALMPYSFQFSCVVPDFKETLGETNVYVLDDDIAVVSSFEHIRGDLLARSKETVVRVTLPAGTLRAGNCRITLVGAQQSMTWTVQVH